MEQTKLSNIQLELLKLYSRNIPEQELLDIKKLLSDYFSQKAIDEADKIWDENNFSNEKMDDLLNS